MRAAVVGTLDEKADPKDVAPPDVARPDNVSELLQGAELVESWLGEPLLDNRVQHGCLIVRLTFTLEITGQT